MQRFSHCSCPAAPFGGSHVSLPVLLPTKRKTHPIPNALELGNKEKKNTNKPRARSQALPLPSFSSVGCNTLQPRPQHQNNTEGSSTQGRTKVTQQQRHSSCRAPHSILPCLGWAKPSQQGWARAVLSSTVPSSPHSPNSSSHSISRAGATCRATTQGHRGCSGGDKPWLLLRVPRDTAGLPCVVSHPGGGQSLAPAARRLSGTQRGGCAPCRGRRPPRRAPGAVQRSGAQLAPDGCSRRQRPGKGEPRARHGTGHGPGAPRPPTALPPPRGSPGLRPLSLRYQRGLRRAARRAGRAGSPLAAAAAAAPPMAPGRRPVPGCRSAQPAGSSGRAAPAQRAAGTGRPRPAIAAGAPRSLRPAAAVPEPVPVPVPGGCQVRRRHRALCAALRGERRRRGAGRSRGRGRGAPPGPLPPRRGRCPDG